MNIIPVFLPHEGCESHCTFCNEYSATGLKKLPVREEILSTVQRYLSYFVDKNNVELAFYGGTFTGSKRQKIYLDIGLELFERKVIKGIRFSTSPGQFNREKALLLRNYPISLVELGVQSFDPLVLKLSNRDHGVKEIYSATKVLKDFSIPFGLHLMTGLPGDNHAKDLISSLEAVRTGAVSVRLHPLVILKDSLLAQDFVRGLFSPPGLEESLEILWKMYLIINGAGVVVNRIGVCLYGNEIKNVVAGPYHPALGELVRNRLMLEVLREHHRLGGSDHIALDKSHKGDFTGHRRYVIVTASNEGIIVQFRENGLRLDVESYLNSIRERLLGGIYAQT